MKTAVITKKNSTFQKFEVLISNRNKRHRYNEFLVEGVRNINEAINNKWRICSFIFADRPLSDWAKSIIKTVPTRINYRISNELMSDLSGKDDCSELLAIVEMRKSKLTHINLSHNPLIVLFDRPSNKGNLGTLIRSCDAFGVDLLITTGHGVDMYDPDVITSTMGSFFNLQVVHIDNNDELMDYICSIKSLFPDLRIIGTTSHNEKPIYCEDLNRPVFLMLGNETMGLNKLYKETCDVLCTIPMSEKSFASSLNISCAGTTLLYEINRQRIGSK